MTEISQLIAQEFSLPLRNINNALELWTEGGTIPFIARYRKERTGSLYFGTMWMGNMKCNSFVAAIAFSPSP